MIFDPSIDTLNILPYLEQCVKEKELKKDEGLKKGEGHKREIIEDYDIDDVNDII